MAFSGYDSEAVGFDSVTRIKKPEIDNATQTSDFFESGTGTQTATNRDRGSQVTPEELAAGDDILKEYPPPGLNDFLRKVVPSMLEQLDLNDRERDFNSSESDEEDIVSAKVFQEIYPENLDSTIHAKGSGDFTPGAILDVSFSSAGNSLAVSIGHMYHEDWCQHDGLIRFFTAKRTEGDKFVHFHDIREKSCVSIVTYHKTIAALLAYGTCSGSIVVCSLRNLNYEGNVALSADSKCHGSKRISTLQWAESALTHSFLTLKTAGKRHGASDQVLISSGCDGRINIWQVNLNLNVFENVVCFELNASKKLPAVDITCLDFMKTYSLKADEMDDDIFVVGTKNGELLACKSKSYQAVGNSSALDPVFDVLEGHKTCILKVSFILERAGVFASLSIDSELRIYDVCQRNCMKIIHIEEQISYVMVLSSPLLMVGLAKVPRRGKMLRLYNLIKESFVSVEGLIRSDEEGEVAVTSIASVPHSVSRLATGDNVGCVRIWDIPLKIRRSDSSI